MRHAQGAKDPDWLRQYGVITRIVDYIERSIFELVVTPGGSAQADWLNQIVRLRQSSHHRPEVSLSVFSPSVNTQPSNLPEVLRQLIWRASDDRQSTQRGKLSWPTLAIKYFEITDRDWDIVDSNLRKFESELGNLPFDAPGLALTHTNQNPSPPPRAYQVQEQQTKRSLHAALSWLTIDVSFNEGDDEDIDLVWTQLWQALEAVCRPGTEIKDYQEIYPIAPGRLAEALFRSLDDDLE
jgi:hypothetical protein